MKKRRVVLDTNVVISAVLFNGAPRQVFQMLLSGEISGCLSIPMLDELREVLQRSKFGLTFEQAMATAEELRDLCDIVRPSSKINAVSSDPDDDKILECAVEGKADFIVSGDTHLTRLGQYQGISILNPSDFLAVLENSKGTK